MQVEAPARPPGERVRARRRDQDHPRRRPPDRRDQPRLEARDRGRDVPRGPLLPAQRRADRAPGAPRAAGATSRSWSRILITKFNTRLKKSIEGVEVATRSIASRPMGGPGNIRELDERDRARGHALRRQPEDPARGSLGGGSAVRACSRPPRRVFHSRARRRQPPAARPTTPPRRATGSRSKVKAAMSRLERDLHRTARSSRRRATRDPRGPPAASRSRAEDAPAQDEGALNLRERDE